MKEPKAPPSTRPNSKSALDSAANKAAQYILENQLPDGAIPWFPMGKLDPWDHCEALMALSVFKQFDAFKRGFTWLQNNQNPDGSWFVKYLADESDEDKDRAKIETNFVAYPATALWHYFLCSGDQEFIEQAFPVIQKSIAFICDQQNHDGDIQWALSSKESLAKDALVTACSSILRSLECAIYLAEAVNESSQRWKQAHQSLAFALKSKPWRFDRTWESKERYSMDWFYPILSGVYSEAESALRLEQDWKKFVIEDLGCLCVSDEPWVTIAESCEWIMAIVASGNHNLAEEKISQLLRWQDEDGGFWTGYVYRDKCIWPREKTTWTAGAFVLAYDAIFKRSRAARLFTSPSGILLSEI